MSRRRRPVALIAVTAVVGLLAVAALTVLGVLFLRDDTPEPTAAPPPPPVPAGPFGEARTADPCSMLPVPGLQSFGTIRIYDDYGPLASCTAQVDGPRGSHLVSATFFAPGEWIPGTPQRRVGSVDVNTLTPTDQTCSRVVIPAGGSAVGIRTDILTGTDPCATADAAATGAAQAVSAGAVGRRQPNPGGTLTSADACRLADPATLPPIAGLDATRQVVGFAAWTCLVGYNPAFTNAPYGSIVYSRLPPLTGTPTPVGRHFAVTTPAEAAAGRPATCGVDIVQRGYVGSSGLQRAEMVRVTFNGTGAQRAADVCRDATALATVVEARMPPPN